MEPRESALGAGPSTPLPQPIPLRARSQSAGSTSLIADPPFSPTLPTDLPHPSGKSLVRKRKASTDLTSGNSKESKVEIELENMEGDGKGTTIPVTVDVSSSTAPTGDPELERLAKKRKDTGNRIISGLILASGFIGKISTTTVCSQTHPDIVSRPAACWTYIYDYSRPRHPITRLPGDHAALPRYQRSME
jgi:hypothetical protein